MLSKIFIKNFSAHKNNYIVYIASSASAVMVYFILFFLTKNPLLSSKIANWKGNYRQITDALSGILLIFEWIFVAYVSGMFIKERKKEFNLYKFLGISRYRIATGIFVETFFIQAISWAVGFVLAVVLSKFFGMALIRVMNLSIDYRFFLNLNILKAVFMTFLIFTLLLSAVNFIRAFRSKDKQKNTRNWRVFRYILGIIGAVMVVGGCYLALHFGGVLAIANIAEGTADNQDFYMQLPFIIFLLVAGGTYFLYVGFLEIVINLISKSSTIKYDGLNNITGKLFDKSLRKNVSSLWIITIMSGLSILMFFVAVILLQSTKYYDDSIYPYDMAINQSYVKDAKKILRDNNSRIKHEQHLTTKQVLGHLDDNADGSGSEMFSVIPYSEYQRVITADQKKYNDDINPNQTMLLNDSGGLVLDIPQKKISSTFTFLTSKKKIKITHYGKSFPISPRLYYGSVLVVPQKLYDQVPDRYQDTLYGINYTHTQNAELNTELNKLSKRAAGKSYVIQRDDDTSKDKLLLMDVTPTEANKYVSSDDVSETQYEMETDKSVYKVSYTSSNSNKQTRGFVIFIISILSVIFVVALESILSIKQFSENIRNRQMYQTIKDLGIGQDNINKLVFRQTALLFFLPMTLAILYAVIGANFLIKISFNDYWYMFLAILILYVFFYNILFFITERISQVQVNKMLT